MVVEGGVFSEVTSLDKGLKVIVGRGGVFEGGKGGSLGSGW